LPIQKPEFVNVSLPVDTLPSKNGSVNEENFDGDSKTAAELDTNYQVSKEFLIKKYPFCSQFH